MRAEPLPFLPGQAIPPGELAFIQRAVASPSSTDVDTRTARLFAQAVALAAPFIEQMNQAVDTPIDTRRRRMTIVRGAFWKEHPWTGARGERILKIAHNLGLEADTVNAPSLDTLAANAARIAAHVGRPDDDRRVLLVSLSKGSAEVKAAFALPETACRMSRVSAWLDLSGTTEGTPVVAQLRKVWWRWLAIRLTLALRRQPIQAISELDSDTALLNLPPKLPLGVRHVRVLGFPLQRHLTNPWARRAHVRLQSQGPNDGGGVLLQRAIDRSPHSTVLPVWAADHYLRPAWNFDLALTALIRTLCTSEPNA